MTLHLVPTAPAPRHGWIADPQVVPCGPVRDLIRRNWPGSQMNLARAYAERYGAVNIASTARMLQRLGDQEWVTVDAADRLCVLLGANFSVLYRDRDIRAWTDVTAESRRRATIQRLANRNARRRQEGPAQNVLNQPATGRTQ